MHKHSGDKTVITGKPLTNNSKVMIMVHGRGATADSILGLAPYLKLQEFTLIAPQATANTWYPHSFMAPVSQNEPGLSTAIEVINGIVNKVKAAGVPSENIYFLGFSQGACLTSEYVARNADAYGGVFIFSGGVIGAQIDKSNYKGDFNGTPIFIGISDIDAHVPLSRSQESEAIFTEMGATVNLKVYPNAPHTVLEDEINEVNAVLER